MRPAARSDSTVSGRLSVFNSPGGSYGGLRSFLHSRMAIVAGGMVAAGAVASIALATIPDSGGVIHGCYDTESGDLRVIDLNAGAKCSKKETAVSWNQTGPQGATGPAGPPGGGTGSSDLSVFTRRIETPVTGTCQPPALSNCSQGLITAGGGATVLSIPRHHRQELLHSA